MTAKRLIRQMQRCCNPHGQHLMETVLKVDEAGKVTALKAGKATSTATAVRGEKDYGQWKSVEEEVKNQNRPELKV